MLHIFGKAGRPHLLAAGFVVLGALAACRPQTEASVTQPTLTPAPATATTTPQVASPPQPIIVVTAAEPATPTSIATSAPDTLSTSTPGEDTVPVTETPPPPTFTPPPPPPALTGEHLWLQRPVPTSGPAWTDKSYPYGSTRGGTLRPHTGVEFVVPTGTPVLATAAGTVVAAGDDATTAYGPQTNFYGNLVVLELDNNSGGSPLFVLYGHLSEVQVAVGQTVAAGDVLGLSGASGVADGPHLHFEVRVGENSYYTTRNPLLWLVPLPGTGVVAGRVTGPNGEPLYEAPVTLVRIDAPAPYTATTTYANGEPNSDGVMNENFAVDDVVPGFYEAIVDAGDRRFTTELWVYPGRTNWVEIVVAP